MDLISIAVDLLNIQQNYKYYLDFKKLKENGYERIGSDDFEIHIFEQTWGNTSGGFEGIGGSAMTNQMTYVLIPQINYDDCLVFFGGRFAYKVPYSQEFIKDVVEHNVKGIHGMGEYLKNN